MKGFMICPVDCLISAWPIIVCLIIIGSILIFLSGVRYEIISTSFKERIIYGNSIGITCVCKRWLKNISITEISLWIQGYFIFHTTSSFHYIMRQRIIKVYLTKQSIFISLSISRYAVYKLHWKLFFKIHAISKIE